MGRFGRFRCLGFTGAKALKAFFQGLQAFEVSVMQGVTASGFRVLSGLSRGYGCLGFLGFGGSGC